MNVNTITTVELRNAVVRSHRLLSDLKSGKSSSPFGTQLRTFDLSLFNRGGSLRFDSIILAPGGKHLFIRRQTALVNGAWDLELWDLTQHEKPCLTWSYLTRFDEEDVYEFAFTVMSPGVYRIAIQMNVKHRRYDPLRSVFASL